MCCGMGFPQTALLNGIIVIDASTTYVQLANRSLRTNMLQLLVRPQEVVSIGFRGDFANIRLLDKVLVTLLLREPDRILP